MHTHILHTVHYLIIIAIHVDIIIVHTMHAKGLHFNNSQKFCFLCRPCSLSLVESLQVSAFVRILGHSNKMFSFWLSDHFKVGEGARIIIIQYHGTMKHAHLIIIYSTKAYMRPPAMAHNN